MPATKFICPDGQRIDIADCLRGCPNNQRCMFLPTLRTVANSLDRKISESVDAIYGARFLNRLLPNLLPELAKLSSRRQRITPLTLLQYFMPFMVKRYIQSMNVTLKAQFSLRNA